MAVFGCAELIKLVYMSTTILILIFNYFDLFCFSAQSPFRQLKNSVGLQASMIFYAVWEVLSIKNASESGAHKGIYSA